MRMKQIYGYYPRKVGEGWRVARAISVLGIRINRFRSEVCSYQEAYFRAEAMNKKRLLTAITTQQEEEVCKKKQVR